MSDYDPSKPILRTLYPDHVDTVLYSEKSEALCGDPATQEQRPMVFQGFESDRDRRALSDRSARPCGSPPRAR